MCIRPPSIEFGTVKRTSTWRRDHHVLPYGGFLSLSAVRAQEADQDGWVLLKVVGCVVGVSRIHRRPLIPVKAGTQIRRAYKTIVKGKPERLLWSDENVRALLSSKFLGNKEHDRWMAMETDEDETKPVRSRPKPGKKPRAPKRPRPAAD
jgi:hypothetical protein